MDNYRILRTACGLLDHSASDRLAMRGADRERFLNGQVTCDVRSAEPGRGIYGFFTSPKGRIEADVTVLGVDDTFWLRLPPGTGSAMIQRLERYIIADRVEIEAIDQQSVLTVLGPTSLDVLQAAVGSDLPSEPYHHRLFQVGGAEGRIVREPDLGGPCFSLWLPTSAVEALIADLEKAGGQQVDDQAYEQLRIEEGRPLWGRDFGPDHFPQESGLEDQAVSYTKGCYLGQEVVARIHYRGGVHRHLRGLAFDRILDGEGRIEKDGKVVGKTGSVVQSTALGRAIGLAVVHERAEPGERVQIVDDDGELITEAEVIGLPFDAGP